MRILITGGAGYLGTELVHWLAMDPKVSELVVYDNLSRMNYNVFLAEKFAPARIHFVRGELLDSRKLAAALEGIDVVYHLAAKVTTPFAHQDPHTFEQINLWGTAELSYLLEESSARQIIYASSTAVYGSGNELQTHESQPKPTTYYGRSKLKSESYLTRLANKQQKVVVLRCGNMYGYNKSMRFDAVINRFLFEAHFQHQVQVKGNGEQQRAFIHIARAARAFARVIHAQLPSGTYNLVEQNYSINEISDTLRLIYPELEVLQTSPDEQMASLLVAPDKRLQPYQLTTPADLYQDLLYFKSHFAF